MQQLVLCHKHDRVHEGMARRGDGHAETLVMYECEGSVWARLTTVKPDSSGIVSSDLLVGSDVVRIGPLAMGALAQEAAIREVLAARATQTTPAAVLRATERPAVDTAAPGQERQPQAATGPQSASESSTTATQEHMDSLDRHPFLPAGIIGAIMAFAGTADLDYGYYTVLRWVLLGAAVVMADYALKSKRTGWVVTAVVIASLWFPGRFFELPRDVWVWLDVAVGIILLVAGVSLPAPPYREDMMGNPVKRWKWWMTTGLVAGIIAVCCWYALQPRSDCQNFVDGDDGNSYCID